MKSTDKILMPKTLMEVFAEPTAKRTYTTKRQLENQIYKLEDELNEMDKNELESIDQLTKTQYRDTAVKLGMKLQKFKK